MKDYKRITMREFAEVTGDKIYNRLAELEDKIESGELVDRNEYLDYLMAAKDISQLTDKEIEFFAKHNASVREEAMPKMSHLIDENSKLRARLKKAVEIKPDTFVYRIIEGDFIESIPFTFLRIYEAQELEKYHFFNTRAKAEERLKELQGGER